MITARSRLALGPSDLPGEDPPPGLRSEIGVEQIGADPAHGAGVDDRRESRVDVLEQGDVGVD